MVFQKDFGFSHHPAFLRHLETKEEQPTVILCHVHSFFVIESQELIPSVQDVFEIKVLAKQIMAFVAEPA